MSQVSFLAACVQNDVEFVVSNFRYDAVVLDSSALEHDQTQASLAGCQVLCVHNRDFLKESRCIAACDSHLTHVRDVEKTTACTAVQVLFQAAKGVLDWHVVACEVYHLGAHLLLMERPKLSASWCGRKKPLLC